MDRATGLPTSSGFPATQTRCGGLKTDTGKDARTISRASASKYFGDDVDDKVERTGCAAPYQRLVDCLGLHDRDWRMCRGELQEFRRCCSENNVPGA
ncbi:ankyrin repeat domain containing protein [Cystoisospora suis]|uniref:Ankyrin repeat domain containing protein n=1 Tax=Cystoisospora suis TaxID=483139 RepID=A0A2C6L3D5_9APIC|nr:ankyrin repeat domain containing protein [Cystoisospora suis]